VISAFDPQDDVEKGENIFKKTQTQSNTEDGNGFSQYSYCLVIVLKTESYSNTAKDWQGVRMLGAALRPAAEYILVWIGIDNRRLEILHCISAVGQGIVQVKEPDNVLANIGGLMAQVFERKDKYVSNKLNEAETAIKDDT
jgi:hypothetical protein